AAGLDAAAPQAVGDAAGDAAEFGLGALEAAEDLELFAAVAQGGEQDVLSGEDQAAQGESDRGPAVGLAGAEEEALLVEQGGVGGGLDPVLPALLVIDQRADR